MKNQTKSTVSILLTTAALVIMIIVTLFKVRDVLRNERTERIQELKEINLKLIDTNKEILQQFNNIRKNSFHFVMNTLIRKCIEKNIPVNVALSLIQMESNFDPNAISWSGDHGLFQFNLNIWKNALEIDEAKLYDPEYNIEIGLTILKKCYEQGGTWGLAVGIYNRGRNHMESKHPEKLARSIFSNGILK